ncbi:MAG: hypothetical protein AAF934_12185 [Bacteroidota bacterium]
MQTHIDKTQEKNSEATTKLHSKVLYTALGIERVFELSHALSMGSE